MAEDWTDAENDAIVADYFGMLAEDLAGVAYNKAAHNRALRAAIVRSEGAVEFKHQNVSAVMLGLGQPWIAGYKPAANFQDSLIAAVLRRLDADRDWLRPIPPPSGSQQEAMGVHAELVLPFGPPPTQRNAPAEIDPEKIARVAVIGDTAGRDERNRALGRAGEQRVLAHEHASLHAAGRPDLAEQVRWVADLDGDGAGFDIASFETDGVRRLIEVKTTNGWERTPFHISRNELAVAEARAENWTLVRMWNFAREPRAFELRPPLDAHVSLIATSFEATFE